MAAACHKFARTSVIFQCLAVLECTVQQNLLHMQSATRQFITRILYSIALYNIQFYSVPRKMLTHTQILIERTVEDRKVAYMLAWHPHQMPRTCLILNRCLARHSASERHDHPTTEMENKEVAWSHLPHLVTWLVMSSGFIDLGFACGLLPVLRLSVTRKPGK